MKRLKLKIFFSLTAVAAIALGIIFWGREQGKSAMPDFIFDKVRRGDVIVSVPAVGTVEPRERIIVSAQNTGKITKFGLDVAGNPISYGSYVKKGMLLAEIDDVVYDSDLKKAIAALAASTAAAKRCEADLERAQAEFLFAEREMVRARKLIAEKSISQREADEQEAKYQIRKAQYEIAKAKSREADIQIGIDEAQVVKAKRTLSYCRIFSPADGLIVDCHVKVGETVVSSKDSTVMFTIATDLKKMKVWAQVNEVDISRIKIGMPANFSVDASADKVFSGVVSRIRLNAGLYQNILFYFVEIDVDNEDGVLIPYLTANVRFIVDKRENTLYVPTRALRYQPPIALIAPEYRERFATYSRKGEAVVWVTNGDHLLRPIPVTAGLQSGADIEIFSSELSENLPIVCGHR